MFLGQACRVPGLHVLGVADLSVDRARAALARVEWPPEQYSAASFSEAYTRQSTHLTADGALLIQADGLVEIGINTEGIEEGTTVAVIPLS